MGETGEYPKRYNRTDVSFAIPLKFAARSKWPNRIFQGDKDYKNVLDGNTKKTSIKQTRRRRRSNLINSLTTTFLPLLLSARTLLSTSLTTLLVLATEYLNRSQSRSNPRKSWSVSAPLITLKLKPWRTFSTKPASKLSSTLSSPPTTWRLSLFYTSDA